MSDFYVLVNFGFVNPSAAKKIKMRKKFLFIYCSIYYKKHFSKLLTSFNTPVFYVGLKVF